MLIQMYPSRLEMLITIIHKTEKWLIFFKESFVHSNVNKNAYPIRETIYL